MALPVLISLTPEEAQRLSAELSSLRNTVDVTEDVHRMVRKLRKAISDAGYGPTSVDLADDNPDPRER